MLVPGLPDLQQLALVVVFIPATSANTPPALVVCPLQLALVVFLHVYVYILTNVRLLSKHYSPIIVLLAWSRFFPAHVELGLAPVFLSGTAGFKPGDIARNTTSHKTAGCICACGWKENTNTSCSRCWPPRVQVEYLHQLMVGKTTSVQVAAGADHRVCKWRICDSWWKENTTSARYKSQDQHQRKLVRAVNHIY